MNKIEKKLRIGVVIDFPEERWESMDLVAEMTLLHLKNGIYGHVVADVITPKYLKIFQSVFTHKKWAWNIDRLINRRVVLIHGVVQTLKTGHYDIVYIVDHSYAHLVNKIKTWFPETPVVIMCHDLDAVSGLDTPYYGMSLTKHLLRWFARPILDGLLNANQIITGSDTVRNAILSKYKSRIRPLQLTTNPYGIAEEFHMKDDSFESVKPLSSPLIVHVGSVIPRKRIDVLLKTVARMAELHDNLTLVRIGGDFTMDQKELVRSLGLVDRIRVMPRLTRLEVANWYRKSDLVLITSESEGFGLPVIEALACGASVVASDIPVLRETGGPFVTYSPVGNSEEFARIANGLLEGAGQGRSDSVRTHLERYQWPLHVERLVEVLESESGLREITRDRKQGGLG